MKTCKCTPSNSVTNPRCLPNLKNTIRYCPMKLHTIACLIDEKGYQDGAVDPFEWVKHDAMEDYGASEEEADIIVEICKDFLQIDDRSNRVDINELYSYYSQCYVRK